MIVAERRGGDPLPELNTQLLIKQISFNGIQHTMTEKHRELTEPNRKRTVLKILVSIFHSLVLVKLFCLKFSSIIIDTVFLNMKCLRACFEYALTKYSAYLSLASYKG